jgi:hypothetical protein
MLYELIWILLCHETCQKYNDKASQFLKKFVTDYSFLYGSQFFTYNVHSSINFQSLSYFWNYSWPIR